MQLKFFPRFQTHSLDHFITTRHGGVSSKPFHTLNLGFHTGDNREHVLENRNRLAHRLGHPLNSFIFTAQVHGNRIAQITGSKVGATLMTTSIPDTDGMITSETGIYLCILTADCLPVLLCDSHIPVIAALHAGRRGIETGIIPKAINLMQTEYNAHPHRILMGIGPAIQSCCYDVDSETAAYFKSACRESAVITQHQNRFVPDLQKTAINQALTSGIEQRNLDIVKTCTCCNSNRYFSYRAASGNRTGRFVTGIKL